MRTIFSLAIASMIVAFAPNALAEKVFGATIPDKVAKLDEGRYRSKEDFEKTMRSFRNAYDNANGVVFQRIPTSPKVKNAYHIQNTTPNRRWDGINVYETVEGKIFIVVLPATPKK